MPKLNFAHLLGRSARASEEDDSKESRKAKSGRAEDDEQEPSAEDEEQDQDAAEDENEEEAGEDDDGDESASEDDGSDAPAVKKGRRAERARCAAIFACREASFRPDMAAHLAFNTSMSAKEAVSLMKTMGTQGGRRGPSLASRMASEQDHRVGLDSDRHQQGASGAMAGLLNAYNTIKGAKK
ncbi:hypothetical protein DO659_03295 [Salmonella enterica subsp. enterica serovar Minnesota]|nr:hypothetical protein [Salmonella enterica subsp. enterica serovar Minnesota]ECI4646674.1 hypothetical protein [Salmonella enterica subsp. salamae]